MEPKKILTMKLVIVILWMFNLVYVILLVQLWPYNIVVVEVVYCYMEYSSSI